MTSLYETWQRDQLATPWQQKPRGKELNGVLGLAKDQLAEGVKVAVKSRFVLLCPPDALAFIGLDRLIERYPVDTDVSYRARLAAAWDTWVFAGTKKGMLAALNAAGFDQVAIYDVHSSPPPAGFVTWPPDANPANWSRFWIEINPGVNDFAFLHWRARTWGDGSLWGDGSTWGSTITPSQVAWVRAIIRKWKPAHTVCASILVRLPGFVLVVIPGM